MPANRGRVLRKAAELFERICAKSSLSSPLPSQATSIWSREERKSNTVPARSDRRRSLLAADHRTPSTSRLARAPFHKSQDAAPGLDRDRVRKGSPIPYLGKRMFMASRP